MIGPDRDSKRAFLAGEGTLTAGEVHRWAVELGEYPYPKDSDDSTELMVSVRKSE